MFIGLIDTAVIYIHMLVSLLTVYSSLSLHSLFVFTFINLKLATLLLPGVSHYLEIDVESISMFA